MFKMVAVTGAVRSILIVTGLLVLLSVTSCYGQSWLENINTQNEVVPSEVDKPSPFKVIHTSLGVTKPTATESGQSIQIPPPPSSDTSVWVQGDSTHKSGTVHNTWTTPEGSSSGKSQMNEGEWHPSGSTLKERTWSSQGSMPSGNSSGGSQVIYSVVPQTAKSRNSWYTGSQMRSAGYSSSGTIRNSGYGSAGGSRVILYQSGWSVSTPVIAPNVQYQYSIVTDNVGYSRGGWLQRWSQRARARRAVRRAGKAIARNVRRGTTYAMRSG